MNKNKRDGKIAMRRHRTSERKGSLELHNGKWRIVALVNGEKIRQSTGTADREEAERIRKEFMAQFTARDAVVQAVKLADAVKTAEAKAEAAAKRAEDAKPALRIADAVEAYLNDATRRLEAPTTAGTDSITRSVFARFAKWIARRHRDCVEMRQFTEAMAKEYLLYLHNQLSPKTCNGHLSVLKRVWSVLMERARCNANPWPKVKRSSGKGRRRENFTPEQIEAIFAKLKPGTELHALCTIGRYTGLRLSDAATMKWSSVNLAENMIELVPMKTKKYGKPVRIPIHESLRTTLTALPRKGAYVLPKSAEDYMAAPARLTGRMAKLLRSAGLEVNEKIDGYARQSCKYGFHSFRHSFVSMCGERGIPLSVVQELVGHLSPDMTQHYFHLGDDAARKAISVLDGAPKAAEPSRVDAAIAALAGLSKDELILLRERLDAAIA